MSQYALKVKAAAACCERWNVRRPGECLLWSWKWISFIRFRRNGNATTMTKTTIKIREKWKFVFIFITTKISFSPQSSTAVHRRHCHEPSDCWHSVNQHAAHKSRESQLIPSHNNKSNNSVPSHTYILNIVQINVIYFHVFIYPNWLTSAWAMKTSLRHVISFARTENFLLFVSISFFCRANAPQHSVIPVIWSHSRIVSMPDYVLARWRIMHRIDAT